MYRFTNQYAIAIWQQKKKKQHSVYIANNKAKALGAALYNNSSGAWLARPRVKP